MITQTYLFFSLCNGLNFSFCRPSASNDDTPVALKLCGAGMQNLEQASLHNLIRCLKSIISQEKISWSKKSEQVGFPPPPKKKKKKKIDVCYATCLRNTCNKTLYKPRQSNYD